MGDHLNRTDPVPVRLGPRDMLSVPQDAWRSVRNVGDERSDLLVVNSGDGRVRLEWDEEVRKAAADAGLASTTTGTSPRTRCCPAPRAPGDGVPYEDRAGPLPLVVVPGMLCDASLWRDVDFPEGHDVHHTPLRRADIGALAEDVLATVPGPFVLVGLSLGAIVGFEALRGRPSASRACA
ncbi:alpha/beta fold hydrolase [Streptomyces melanosporofaciens]|uniref:alpha/beta fold hydrolase n=1 Tax=Streptomyces melanosporofaciens TaxID=67327 RepID=UPI000A92F584|nr:hypothetical protein [Streptomyces melanosporofaciens]